MRRIRAQARRRNEVEEARVAAYKPQSISCPNPPQKGKNRGTCPVRHIYSLFSQAEVKSGLYVLTMPFHHWQESWRNSTCSHLFESLLSPLPIPPSEQRLHTKATLHLQMSSRPVRPIPKGDLKDEDTGQVWTWV